MLKRITFIILLIKYLVVGSLSAQINTDNYLRQAYHKMQNEQYIEAIQSCNRIINAKPYLNLPYEIRGYCKFKLDDYVGAKRDFLKALELNPYSINTFNFLGILSSKQEKYDEAIGYYTKGLEYHDNDISLLINRGDNYRLIKQYSKAIEDYNNALKIDDKQLNVYMSRGAVKYELGDTIGAIKDYSNIIKRNPLLVDGYWRRGILFQQMGESEKALSDYNQAIKLKDSVSDFYLNRGVIYARKGEAAKALEDYNKALELDYKNKLAYKNRGLIYNSIKEYDKAILDFGRVLAIDSGDLLTLYNRAEAYNKAKKYRLAKKDLDIIIANFPNYDPAYRERARAKRGMNDFWGAEQDYLKSMKLVDENNKGNTRTAENNIEGGIDKEKSIKNHDQIAVVDDFKSKIEYSEITTLKGFIQDKNIFIDMADMFNVALAEEDTLLERIPYYSFDVDKFNRSNNHGDKVQLVNNYYEVRGLEYVNTNNKVDLITGEMQFEEDSSHLVFIRAILYTKLANYTSAINDYDVLLKDEPKNILALLNRSFARLKMVEAIKSMEDEFQVDNHLKPQNSSSILGAKKKTSFSNSKKTGIILDYELILNDLNEVIELSPEFEMAYYNRAIIHCLKKDFLLGIKDFSRAIDLNPDFAEAYFNRGLTLIYLKQEAEGTADLSKAGELGIYKAYNVIKRYGAEDLQGGERIADVE